MFLLLLLTAGCSPLTPEAKNTAPVNNPAVGVLRDGNTEIKLAVLEHMIRQLHTPPTNTILFVELSESGLGDLSRRLPEYRIKPYASATLDADHKIVDKVSRERGVALVVSDVKISEDSARAIGSFCVGPSVSYQVTLERRPGWKVRDASTPIIGD